MLTRTRRRIIIASALVAATLAASGCTATDSGQGSIEIRPLFVQGDGGGVGTETITRGASEDGGFRLEFSEDEVSGLGDASRAASWNAAIVSTLLTGQPLHGSFGFEIQGRIDGPSAGALKTVALIALQRGDEVLETATMTGTINATGSIGPVGGIPEKLQGAADEGFETVLIPLGQRNSANAAGESVDVVREGERLGVEVVEVGDLYEAYPLLTGEELPAPPSGNDPRLDNRSYDKVDAQVGGTLSRYDEAFGRFSSMAGEVQQLMRDNGVVGFAEEARAEAEDLQRQGLIAGAFGKAQEAAAYMETAAAAGELLTPLYTQGLDGLGTIIERALDTSAAEGRFTSFLDQLGTYSPETLPDVEALTVAYARAFDAYTLLDYATAQLDTLYAQFEEGAVPDLEVMFNSLSLSMLYAELAKSQIANAQALFELGRDNPGAAIDADLDLAAVGDFFRRGADANYAAFTTSGLVPSLAESNGVSVDVVIGFLSQYDLNVAAAQHQQAVLPVFEEYIGADDPNAAYAAMGYGVSNYVRNQVLVEKYYNNAELDENYQITGVQFEGALDNAIDLGRDQLGAEISALREEDTSPVITVGSYEAAGLMEGGEPQDGFDALGEYSYGFVTARLLAYLGGLEGANAIG